MSSAVKTFQLMQQYVKAFAENKNDLTSSLSDLPAIKEIAIYNKIWPIIKDVAYGNHGNEDNEWRKNKEYNYNRIHACMEIFAALEDLNIPYAVIKGAYLDKTAYKNRGLRGSYDIDILIEKKNYKRLHQIMEQFGFISGEWNYQTKQIEKFSRKSMLYNIMHTHQTAPYVRLDYFDGYVQDISVDINYSISWGEDEYGVSFTSQLLKDTGMAEYENLKYRVLNPEAFLMQICMHSYRDMNAIILIKNGNYKLRLLCDVYYFIYFNADRLNHDKFIHICKQHDYQTCIYYVLYYTTLLFGHHSWIALIMESIKPEDLSFLNTYGLSAEERKPWPIDFQDRVLCNPYSRIRPDLTEKDINKMDIIHDNMQLRQ